MYVIDLKTKFKNFWKNFKIILSEKNCLRLYKIEGFGMHIIVMKKNIIYYKLSNYYKPHLKVGLGCNG